jgi:hypothetical protein
MPRWVINNDDNNYKKWGDPAAHNKKMGSFVQTRDQYKSMFGCVYYGVLTIVMNKYRVRLSLLRVLTKRNNLSVTNLTKMKQAMLTYWKISISYRKLGFPKYPSMIGRQGERDK